MQQEVVTLVVAGMGIAGTLTSGLLTQHFTRTAQREQWELDKKTAEYRELLDALTAAYLEACEIARSAAQGLVRESEDDESEPSPIQMTAYRTLRNRLFTAFELEGEDVTKRWDTAIISFSRDGKIETFAARFSNISETIVWLAAHKGKRPEHI